MVKIRGKWGESWKYMCFFPIASLPLDLSGASLQLQELTCCRYFCWENRGYTAHISGWKQCSPFNFEICTQTLLCLLQIFSDNSLVHD